MTVDPVMLRRLDNLTLHVHPLCYVDSCWSKGDGLHFQWMHFHFCVDQVKYKYLLPDLKASSKTYLPGIKSWRPKVLLPLNLVVVRFMTNKIP